MIIKWFIDEEVVVFLDGILFDDLNDVFEVELV